MDEEDEGILPVVEESDETTAVGLLRKEVRPK